MMGKDVRLWDRDKGLYYPKHDRQHEFSRSHLIPLRLTGVIKVVLVRVDMEWVHITGEESQV